MDLVEQVHIFGLSNNHTCGSNISLIRLFSLAFNYAKAGMIPSTTACGGGRGLYTGTLLLY